MTKHYDVEYSIVGCFVEQVYDVDNEDEAVAKAMDELRYKPIVIDNERDIQVTCINEVDYD